MKTKIKLTDFFNYTDIKYDDDLYCSPNVSNEFENFSIENIIYKLPTCFKLTEEQLEKYPELKENLNHALNEANHDSLLNACIDEQEEMVEKFANEIIDYVNQIEDEYGKKLLPLNNIKIDWSEEVAIIDFNTTDALSTIREIMNGEGQFTYKTINDLAEEYNGKNQPKETVIRLMYYLLNIKLIDSIYGMTGKPNQQWEVTSWNIDETIFKNRLLDNLTDEQYQLIVGKLNPNTYTAITLRNRIINAEDDLKTLRKELYLAKQKVPKKDLQLYVDAIA